MSPEQQISGDVKFTTTKNKLNNGGVDERNFNEIQ